MRIAAIRGTDRIGGLVVQLLADEGKQMRPGCAARATPSRWLARQWW